MEKELTELEIRKKKKEIFPKASYYASSFSFPTRTSDFSLLFYEPFFLTAESTNPI